MIILTLVIVLVLFFGIIAASIFVTPAIVPKQYRAGTVLQVKDHPDIYLKIDSVTGFDTYQVHLFTPLGYRGPTETYTGDIIRELCK